MFRHKGPSVLTLATALLATGALACTAEISDPQPTAIAIGDGLTVVRTADEIRGTFESADGVIEFASARTEHGAILNLTINGATFDREADLAYGMLTTDGRDAVLTDQDKAALAAFADTLGAWLATNEGQPHEMFAAVSADYWSAAPAGHVHHARSTRVDVREVTPEEIAGERSDPALRSNGDDGIKCIRKGNWYTAVYDKWKSGTVIKQSVKCNADWGRSKCGSGDYDCMGRCGSGCDNWWAPSSYTLDCLDHDTCSHDMCATGGSDDKHCGDEYNKADDDWTWGVWEGCDG